MYGAVNNQSWCGSAIMNKRARVVRKQAATSQAHGAEDRRVRRTTQALTHALVALVQEQQYDTITVQDLLDRADVGRSTFYCHYRSKDDLLLRSFEALLDRLDGAMNRVGDPSSPRVAPARELFHHVGEFQSFHRSLARGRMLERLYQAGTNQLSRTIAPRLAALTPRTDRAIAPHPVMAQALAGALFALLRWWVDKDAPYSPEEMDEMYHTLRP